MYAMTVNLSPPLRQRLHTHLVDVLECNLPILCAGMGGVSRAHLTAAVSNAGGLGCLGMVREHPQFIADQIRLTRKMTQAPFAVNIIPAATAPRLLEQQLDVILDSGIQIVTLFWDVYPKIITRLRHHGVTVLHQIGSVQDARTALDAGAHVLIAQGKEAGGHVHGQVGSFTLLSEIVECSPIPVVAAGGIGNGQEMLAALDLGAQGVCCGTAFLATQESAAHDYHKHRVLQANAEDTVYSRCFYLNWPENAPVRTIKNSTVNDFQQLQQQYPNSIVIAKQDEQPIYLFSTDSPLENTKGELEKMALYAGESCSQVKTLCSAEGRIEQFLKEAENVMKSQSHPVSHSTPDHAGDTQFASSPCQAQDTDPEYHGYLNEGELLETLQLLLEAERAGTRICKDTLKQTESLPWRELLRAIQADEVESCQLLMECIEYLGSPPSTGTSDFYQKCMTIDNLNERLMLLNKGQEWVVRKINGILARIQALFVFERLRLMRDRHTNNVCILKEQFSKHPKIK